MFKTPKVPQVCRESAKIVLVDHFHLEKYVMLNLHIFNYIRLITLQMKTFHILFIVPGIHEINWARDRRLRVVD